MRFILFATVLLLVMAAANYYIYRRFFRRLSGGFSRFAAVPSILLMIGELLFVLDNDLHFLPQSTALYMTNAAFIGFTFMLFVVATFYDLSLTVSSKVPFDQGRRRFIKVIFDIGMLIAASGYLLQGLAQGTRKPRLNPVRVPVRDFHAAGFSLVQLSDIHVGLTIKRDFVAELVQRSNALKPSLVVITGDLIDQPVEKIRDDLAPLRELQAPAYFILGNHEYFHGPQAALDYIRSLGIRPLLNDCVQLEHAGQRFNLVGINDLVGSRMGVLPPDVERAFAGSDPALPTIVLAHQPKSIDLVSERRCDLMLSGHTHGGQIFPFGYLVMIDQPYLAGLHRNGHNQQIFVSRGAGYWGPPLRVLAPSEISHIFIEPA